jgi:hypothetical protein
MEMNRVSEDIAFEGWKIALRHAGASLAGECFYAAYTGDAFGQPERGVIAAIACGHSDPGIDARGAGAAAELVIHSFAEGYFGAPRTLSAKRAAGLSLQSINAWLFGQIRNDTVRHFVPVSLAALTFGMAGFGIVHAGSCRLYRRRQGIVTLLTRDHLRIARDGHLELTHAIGLDPEVSIDYVEEIAEVGDSYLLVSGLADEGREALPAGEDIGSAAVMVLDILEVPLPDAVSSVAAYFAGLPIRPPPREGDEWDGFVIGKTLYRGRYTFLKAAYDNIGKREVALKIPLPSMLHDEIFAAGFMREAWIGTTVRGASIARYLELPPERRSSLYLVMPLYKGETLEARLNRAPLVSLPEGIGIALRLCEAVQDLAAVQIVHRDIKPDNIMLLFNNEIRLLDLGLAYLPGIDLADAAKPGGTIRYMAPELLRGSPANARTEVFALVVTLYRMFSAGAYPFGQHEAVPLARLRPDLPCWLGQCVARGLAPLPAERYADAGELALALQAGLVDGTEDSGVLAKSFPLSRLQIWQALTFFFAAGFLFLLLRSFK